MVDFNRDIFFCRKLNNNQLKYLPEGSFSRTPMIIEM